jgi:hypothetical protein
MFGTDRWARSAVMGLSLAITVVTAGCAGSVEYRAYDPYYHDYHVWGAAETPYYNQWVGETHHPNVEYGRLHKKDQQAYWRWRHDHH